MFYKTIKICITKYIEIIKTILVRLWEGALRAHEGGWHAGGAPRAWQRLRHHVWSRAIFCEVVPLGPALGQFFGRQTDQHFAKKPFVFGQEATTVLYCYIQCPPLYFW